jgi:polyhydroxybutyrate depolymerase
MVHDEYNRSWIMVLPNDYSSQDKYPLVLALHGSTGSAKQLMMQTKRRFNKLANRDKFIMVYPQGVRNSWNDNTTRDRTGYARKHDIDDVGFIDKLIKRLESSYSIDRDHIFVCGISNGGLLSQTLAMELPGQFKAIGMVASNFGEDQVNEARNVLPFSILFIHGTADSILPYEKGIIQVFDLKRGKILGVEKSIEYMCDLNGNTKPPVTRPLENTSLRDGCTSEHISFPNPMNPDLKVELIKVNEGGHTWPGARKQRRLKRLVGTTTRDFNACDALWEFFKSHLN